MKRKRKPGRPSRAQQRAEEWQNMQTALRNRCRVLGWRVTEANVRAARSPLAGTLWGRLLLDEQITNRQFQALDRFRTVLAKYEAAISAPPRHVQTRVYDDGPRGRGEETPEEVVKRATNEFMAAEGALGMAGRLARAAVMVVMQEEASTVGIEPGTLRNLRDGADALADLFMIDCD